MSETITRFAPSPTGHLHVGGARTALFCWALARMLGGRFILRIEDTDQARSSEDATAGILRSMAWLGLDWDEGPEWVDRLSEPMRGLGEGHVADGEEGGSIGSESRSTWDIGSESRSTWDIGSESRSTRDPRGVGPFYQAQRLGHYNAAVERLIALDRAYPAFETPEELDAARAAVIERKETYRYDRKALETPREERLARMRAGEEHVVRFKMPGEAIVVRDDVLGDVRLEAEQLDDFVIRKRDGFPTYHLACVVDDELMGVTHILRGQEHLINTPRHVALQRALGYRTPTYAHLPLIFNPDGSKMSKRDKDKAAKAALREAGLEGEAYSAFGAAVGMALADIDAWLGDKKAQLPLENLDAIASWLGVVLPEINVSDFEASGYLPEVLCNYLGLLGWNPGMKNEDGTDLERFDLAFLCEHFSIERLGKKAGKFDRDKLLAFNADTIQGMSDEEFLGRWRAWAEEFAGVFDRPLAERLDDLRDDRWGLALARAARPRTRTLRDAADHVRFALIADDAVEFDEKALAKALKKGEPSGLERLREIEPVIASIEPFEPEVIEGRIKAWCEERGVGMGKIAQPLRVAVTGRAVSPGLGETLALVGREGAVSRIDRCLELHAE